MISPNTAAVQEEQQPRFLLKELIFLKKVIFNEERCKSCELCVSVCPKKILRISDDKMNEKGYKPAEIFEQDKCIGCAFCATICPDAAITIEED